MAPWGVPIWLGARLKIGAVCDRGKGDEQTVEMEGGGHGKVATSTKEQTV